jgi:hypothetical protein
VDFHFHFVNCSCCRAKFDGQEEGKLCPICAIWNTKDGFSKRLVPVWQRLVGEQFHDIIDEVRGELYDYIDHDVGGLWEIGAEYEVEDDAGEMAGDETEVDDCGRGVITQEDCFDWSRVLQIVTGREAKSSDDPLEHSPSEHCPPVAKLYLEVAEIVARRADLALFRDGGASETDIDEGLGAELSGFDLGPFTIAVHERGMMVDRVAVRSGCGKLLLSYITQSVTNPRQKGHPAHRFNGLHSELCREDGSLAGNDCGQQSIRRKMIRRQFQAIGDANAPPPYIQVGNFNQQDDLNPPPLCSWNDSTYSLGIHLEGGRHLLELPRNIDTLEFFVRTWRGRYGSESALRLRGACMELAILFGKKGDDVPITPHERSFQLLRAVIESNPEMIDLTDDGMLITGTSGTQWWMWPGEGAHGSSCIIAPADPRIDDPLDDPGACLEMICLFESKQHLPLGDRVVANVLGLLNDEAMAQRIHQVRGAIHSVDMIRRRG